MNENQDASSAPPKSEVLKYAILTPFVVIMGFCLIVSVLGAVLGGNDPYSFLAVPFAFGAAFVFSGASALSSPFFLNARIARPRVAGVIALAATFGSFLLIWTGITQSVSRLFSFSTQPAEVYEPIATTILLHVGLTACLCLLYRARRSHAESRKD